MLLQKLQKCRRAILITPFIDKHIAKLLRNLVDRKSISIILIIRHVPDLTQLEAISVLARHAHVEKSRMHMLITAMTLAFSSLIALLGYLTHNPKLFQLLPIIPTVAYVAHRLSRQYEHTIIRYSGRRGSLITIIVNRPFHAKLYALDNETYIATLNLTREGVVRNLECICKVNSTRLLVNVVKSLLHGKIVREVFTFLEHSHSDAAKHEEDNICETCVEEDTTSNSFDGSSST